MADGATRRIRGNTLGDVARAMGREMRPFYLLFECASGYALFLAHGVGEVDTSKFQAVEEYINRSPQPLELIDFQSFSSPDDALAELNAISSSNVTEKLKKFLQKNLRPPKKYAISTVDSNLGARILRILMKAQVAVHRSILIDDVMRSLRDKIDKFLGLEPGVLANAQLNLARLHNQMCTEMDTTSPVVVSASYYLQEQLRVVPHRFEGFFKIIGKENLLCTKNLVHGEARYGEKLLCVQNEDKTEVEYRVWDPVGSKLGAAIMGGITDIWIRPGSRVLYMGNVSGLTVCNLSDLVGSEGLVYVIRFPDSDDVVKMSLNRLNVVTITETFPYCHVRYRMLVGMVDVIFAEIDHCPDHPPGQQVHCPEVNFIVNNAHFYLRAGGHYMISTQVNNHSSHFKNPFARYDRRQEFKQIETFMLDGAYAMSVGGYRI